MRMRSLLYVVDSNIPINAIMTNRVSRVTSLGWNTGTAYMEKKTFVALL